MKILRMVILWFFFFTTVSFAAECTEDFSWLPNDAADNVTGYRIYYGLVAGGPYNNSASFSNPVPGGDGRIHVSVSSLTCGEHYYFICKAVNDANVESDPSDLVDFVVIDPNPGGGEGDVLTKVFGSAEGADYPGTIQDTYLNLNAVNNGGSLSLNTYTWPTDTVANAIIVKIDIGQLPSGAVIQSANLELYTNSSGGDSTYAISAHKIINHSPNMVAATGYTYDGSTGWTANTSCYNNIPMAQADIGASVAVNNLDMSLGYKNWDIAATVREWVASPASNYGVLLNSDTVASSDSYRNFASSEATAASQRPKLTVTYIVDDSVPSAPAATSGFGVTEDKP